MAIDKQQQAEIDAQRAETFTTRRATPARNSAKGARLGP